ncbi:hypothetical protein phiOC_p112 [Ochrobactrum phage vB_OspM_OC]|nr:hypothetical protein phiOC_p112 [Ochrobactrum phage vB_OspM_OC]
MDYIDRIMILIIAICVIFILVVFGLNHWLGK